MPRTNLESNVGPAPAVLAVVLMIAYTGPAYAESPATVLQSRHVELQSELSNNAFGRPLHIDSAQRSGDLKADAYAVVKHSFTVVGPTLQKMANWCDILILHLNIKQCRTSQGIAPLLRVQVGRKFDQPLNDTYQVDFQYDVLAADSDYLQVRLNAAAGPLGTKDYRIVLEAVPLDPQRSFVHMSFSYSQGLAARLAMQSYLATGGSSKVGFSVVDRRADGTPIHIRNMRGVIERNTMRYYLAIEAFLGAHAAPAAIQVEKRLNDWFAATERHALQLHELERSDYLQMKRNEVARQQAAQTAL